MPFGEELDTSVGARSGDGLNYSSETDNVRQKFTGYEKDRETGLDFAEARMYSGQHARFTAVDPLLASGKSANPQTFNRYVYVLNSPLMFNDPNGLQVGIATGRVYINVAGTQVRIFQGAARKGFVPLDHNISTTTMVGKVAHHFEVTPNGWTIGGRVDGATFAPPAAPAKSSTPVENAAIRALATTASYGVYNESVGIVKGVVNSPVFALNGLTDLGFRAAYFHATGGFYSGPNPFAARNILPYSNSLQGSAGSAGSTGFLAGLGPAVGVFGGGTSVPSITSEFNLFSRAEAARDAAMVADGRKYATYIGGYTEDGAIAVGRSTRIPNICAEEDVARQLGSNVKFTEAMGWRTVNGELIRKPIPTCPSCEANFSPFQFPKSQ